MKHLTRQIVVRVTPAMHADLERVADENERTVAQEVRFRLRRALGLVKP